MLGSANGRHRWEISCGRRKAQVFTPLRCCPAALLCPFSFSKTDDCMSPQCPPDKCFHSLNHPESVSDAFKEEPPLIHMVIMKVNAVGDLLLNLAGCYCCVLVYHGDQQRLAEVQRVFRTLKHLPLHFNPHTPHPWLPHLNKDKSVPLQGCPTCSRRPHAAPDGYECNSTQNHKFT